MKTPELRRGFFMPAQHVGQPYAGTSPATGRTFNTLSETGC